MSEYISLAVGIKVGLVSDMASFFALFVFITLEFSETISFNNDVSFKLGIVVIGTAVVEGIFGIFTSIF
jgi:hypothetical protein